MLLSIRHYEFTVTEPYHAGDALSANDAAILNRLRHLNIREAFLRRIPKRGLLPIDDLRILRERVTAYDAALKLPAPPPLKPVWTLDEELRLLRAENFNGGDIEATARRRYAARLSGVPGPVSDYIWEPSSDA